MPSKQATPRTLRTVELLRKIWGAGYEKMITKWSPHYGDVLAHAEAILHELAHQTLMPKDYVFSPGNMSVAGNLVAVYLESRSLFVQDLHEIKTIAIELLVARRLKLGISRAKVLASSLHGMSLFIDEEEDLRHFNELVRRAQKLKSVQFKADTIMYFITEQRKSLSSKSSDSSRPGAAS